MVLIAARMVEKIHLEGKKVEQKGAPFFVWLLKAYGGWGGAVAFEGLRLALG